MKSFSVAATLMVCTGMVSGTEPVRQPLFGGPPAPWVRRPIAPPKPPPAPVIPRDPALEAQAERAAAEAVLRRRLEACDKLRELTPDSDKATLAEIDRYELDAFELYKQATAHLPCSRMLPSEQRLEKQIQPALPAAEAAERLTDRPVSVQRTTTASTARGGMQ